ncbi:MAG: hypothetical protein QNJ53_05075 [Pleurocapsa sp. MO_192.B19]|nr:hypothetical protein [Pleurocapsa sp. MO_192.B19]
MNLPTVLNIVIGLILIYIIWSLVLSEIQELIATLLEWRAKNLKDGIAQLFGESSSDDPLVSKFYNNPLIQTLNHKGTNSSKSKGPSYISASSFYSAFMDIIQAGKEIPKTLDELMNNVENNPELPEGLKQTLSSLSKKAKSQAEDTSKEISQMETEVENWFNSSMERLSGVYKRNAKGVALIIALAIAIIANVDTIYIVNSLSQDKALQSTIERVANQVVSSNSCLQITDSDTNKADCLTGIKSDVNQAYTNLSPLPFGWDLSHPLKKQLAPFSLENVVKIFVGWLLTGIAISMGAPFWFDLLSTVINVRNTGNKIDTKS